MIDVIIICVLTIVIGSSIFWTIRNKIKGKSACGCCCANCQACTSCSAKKSESGQ